MEHMRANTASVEQLDAEQKNLHLGNRGFGAVSAITGIIVMIFGSIVLQAVINNATGDGKITGLAATVAPYIVPLLFVGALVVAALAMGGRRGR